MKIVKGLAPFLLLVFAVSMIIGCSHSEKADVKGVITNELNLLKNLDSDTVQKYISYKELFPDATEKIELSREVEEVFSLFFQDFDYKDPANQSRQGQKRSICQPEAYHH